MPTDKKYCNDCQEEMNKPGDGIVHSVSNMVGLCYNGEPICKACLVKREKEIHKNLNIPEPKK